MFSVSNWSLTYSCICDDIIVINSTFDEHLSILSEILRRLREARLKLNTKKCKFCVNQLIHLGHRRLRGNTNRPGKSQCRRSMARTPHCEANKAIYWSCFIIPPFYKRFRDRCRSVDSTDEKTRAMSVGSEAKSFKILKDKENIKDTLTTVPILACPDFTRKFILQIDASNTGLGAVLTQNFTQGERVIAPAEC